MLSIYKLQQRDLEALAELHPENDFENAYLEHLQELRHILVASHKNEAGLRTYFGYVGILWESQYTPFWRQQIPEIIKLYVAEPYRRQGIAKELIKAIEVSTHKKGYHRIGVRLAQLGDFAIARDLYQTLGYEASNFENGEKDKLSLVKVLP